MRGPCRRAIAHTGECGLRRVTVRNRPRDHQVCPVRRRLRVRPCGTGAVPSPSSRRGALCIGPTIIPRSGCCVALWTERAESSSSHRRSFAPRGTNSAKDEISRECMASFENGVRVDAVRVGPPCHDPQPHGGGHAGEHRSHSFRGPRHAGQTQVRPPPRVRPLQRRPRHRARHGLCSGACRVGMLAVGVPDGTRLGLVQAVAPAAAPAPAAPPPQWSSAPAERTAGCLQSSPCMTMCGTPEPHAHSETRCVCTRCAPPPTLRTALQAPGTPGTLPRGRKPELHPSFRSASLSLARSPRGPGAPAPGRQDPLAAAPCPWEGWLTRCSRHEPDAWEPDAPTPLMETLTGTERRARPTQ